MNHPSLGPIALRWVLGLYIKLVYSRFWELSVHQVWMVEKCTVPLPWYHCVCVDNKAPPTTTSESFVFSSWNLVIWISINRWICPQLPQWRWGTWYVSLIANSPFSPQATYSVSWRVQGTLVLLTIEVMRTITWLSRVLSSRFFQSDVLGVSTLLTHLP